MIPSDEVRVGIRVKIVDTYRDAVNKNGVCVYNNPEDLDEGFRSFLGNILTISKVYDSGLWFRVEENGVEWNIYDVSYIVEDEVELGKLSMDDIHKMLF